MDLNSRVDARVVANVDERTNGRKTGSLYRTFKTNIISIKNTLLTRTSSVILRLRAIVLLHVWLYDFYDTTLATE